jgi:hypothetical protein
MKFFVLLIEILMCTYIHLYWRHILCYSLFREVQRTAGVSTTDLVGRMLLMTRQHFRRGPLEYDVGHEGSSQLGLDSDARSPYTGCSQFLPTTQKIIQFSDGKPPKVQRVKQTSDVLLQHTRSCEEVKSVVV